MNERDKTAPIARELTISRALEQVRLMANASGQGEALQSRQTLDALCAEWSDELGRMSYPAPVLEALRAAGLDEKP